MSNLIVLHCYRCNKDWASRVPSPKQCPKCRSPYWNKPRKGQEAAIILPVPPIQSDGMVGNVSIGYRTKIMAVRQNGKCFLPLPTAWIDKYMNNYQEIYFNVRIRGQGIYIVPDHQLSTAKERVMAKHPNCHTILEVIDEQCRQQGITYEQYFARLSDEERAGLKEAIK